MSDASPRRTQRNTLSSALTTGADSGWSPFHAAAADYLSAGYMPFPLSARKKFPPPKGVPNDIVYTTDQVSAWLRGEYNYRGQQRIDNRPKNIGTIVPDGLVVFDVDGKPGMETLAEYEERLGPLPKTWVSFRGENDRYHLWFVTKNGLRWPGKLGAGLDVIYRHYRYMVLPPSIHPNGNEYRWANLSRDGSLRDSRHYFPAPDEHSDLPEAWYALADDGGYQRRDRAEVDARLWLQEHGRGEPCPEIKRVVNRHLREIRKHADLGGMHDALVNSVWAVTAEISQGHVGGFEGLRRIRDCFFRQAEASGRRGRGEPEAEWQRACIGAIEKTAIERVRDGDPCTVEESEESDPNRFFDGKYGLKARTLRRAIERTGRLAVGPGRIIYRHHNGLWTPDGESEVYRRATRLLGQRYRPSHASNVLSVVSNREPLITDDSQDTRYLNLPNGLLDWQEGRLYPHNSAIVSTVRIPIEWDEDADCPDIDQFFSEVFPGDAVELAYEILGYMLYNDNPLHKAILLYGSGRNGKGTFIRLARMLVGHNNISAVTPQALDSSQFSSAQLYGKLANLVGDVDPRIFRSTEQFKQLTGGDYMMAQHKHKDPFVFRCRALMIAGFNALPRTADTTEGFFSRWAVVPFTAFFPAGVADPTLIHRLTTQRNLQGLLRMAVGGLQQVMRRGAFANPPSVVKATQRFREEADPVRGFIRERVRKGNGFTARTDVYNAYVAWATVNGFSQLSAARFYESLNAVMAGIALPVLRQGTRGYKGIVLE